MWTGYRDAIVAAVPAAAADGDIDTAITFAPPPPTGAFDGVDTAIGIVNWDVDDVPLLPLLLLLLLVRES